MNSKQLETFKKERERLNDSVLKYGDQVLKRFFSLDTQTYREGVLDVKTKEMLGLVASLVLRCDDCITYHIDRCSEEGVSSEELAEVLSVGMVVGGSITIPHIRRALDTWDALVKADSSKPEVRGPRSEI
jgi:AhpD family alkylhydroperoxidase